MRSRIKKVFAFKKEFEKEYAETLSQLEKIHASGSDTLVICLDNTGSSFLGVKNATMNLFPGKTLLLPAYYSHVKLTERQMEGLTSQIVSKGFRQVILGSLPSSLNGLLLSLKNKVAIKAIFHGSLSELSDEKNEKQLLQLFKLCKEGSIQKIGFVKSGLSEWCTNLYGIPSNWLLLFPLERQRIQKQPNRNQIHIGVFANTSFNKNLHNQIAAALSIPNAIVHTFADSKFFNHFFADRIKTYPFMAHNEFVSLMASMDVNLHLSFSEGMGGQTFTESLSQGVPCITSYNNEYLKSSAFLSTLLITDQYDNPWQIKLSIERVLSQDQAKLSNILVDFSKQIHSEAQRLLHEFMQ